VLTVVESFSFSIARLRFRREVELLTGVGRFCGFFSKVSDESLFLMPYAIRSLNAGFGLGTEKIRVIGVGVTLSTLFKFKLILGLRLRFSNGVKADFIIIYTNGPMLSSLRRAMTFDRIFAVVRDTKYREPLIETMLFTEEEVN
jgi:hypothetical protein